MTRTEKTLVAAAFAAPMDTAVIAPASPCSRHPVKHMRRCTPLPYRGCEARGEAGMPAQHIDPAGPLIPRPQRTPTALRIALAQLAPHRLGEMEQQKDAAIEPWPSA